MQWLKKELLFSKKNLLHTIGNLKTLLYAFILIIQTAALNGQNLGIDLLGSRNSMTIPFDYSQGFILVELKFNGILPLRFIFDTGAEHTILFKKPIADIMGITYERRINLMGADLDQQVYALIARNIPISLYRTRTIARDIIVLEEDFLHMEELTGENIDGILGGRMLRGLVVEIDYRNKRLVLTNPEAFDQPEDPEFREIDITIDNHKPYFKTEMETLDGLTLPITLLVDTGASLTFLLYLNTHPSLVLPEIYTIGNLGRGLGGNVEGFLSKVRKLKIGNELLFQNVITNFQKIDEDLPPEYYASKNGLLGNVLLSRFTIIIDYTRERLFLKPSKKYNREFKYDKSGLVLYAFGRNLNQYYVKTVIDGSPADEAGLMEGDLLKRVGIWPASWMSISKITSKFEKKDGKVIKIAFDRNGQRLKTKIKLRDFFTEKTKKEVLLEKK